MRRVVVTGIGIVSCLGNNQEEVYQSLLNSKSGISYSEEYKEHNLRSQVHGKPNIKLEDHIDRKTITFSIEGPPEPITIPVLKLLTLLSSNPESSIASFIAT